MKAISHISLFTITLLLSFSRTVTAQVGVMPTYPDHKLGPYSASHRFVEVPLKDYGYDYFHHFKPKKKKINGYYDTGKIFHLNKNSTIELAQLYKGEYNGKKGLWIHPFSPHFAYIYLGDVVDIEKEVQVAEVASAKAHQELIEEERAEQISSFLKLLPYILAFIGLIILLNKLSKNSQPSHTYSSRRGGTTFGSSSSTNYSSSSNNTSFTYNQPQESKPSYTPDNSYQRFEFERRSAERASRINHILYNCDLNDANKQELERLRRDQNADNYFNS